MCLGTGIYQSIDQDRVVIIQDPCETCGGTGYLEEGKSDTTEIINELDWIKKKIKKILTKLEVPEE